MPTVSPFDPSVSYFRTRNVLLLFVHVDQSDRLFWLWIIISFRLGWENPKSIAEWLVIMPEAIKNAISSHLNTNAVHRIYSPDLCCHYSSPNFHYVVLGPDLSCWYPHGLKSPSIHKLLDLGFDSDTCLFACLHDYIMTCLGKTVLGCMGLGMTVCLKVWIELRWTTLMLDSILCNDSQVTIQQPRDHCITVLLVLETIGDA